ncbi:coiled-coil domain-containing protein 13 isoform X2 [Sphaerodactylus townsendi]|uniref:coiled-coil domain-containing protein 13 isoform X2 n=1 Tax=Sphaerodactylus townsendi TaxID=933632 RepID=UPI00202765BC|nr:coiled-coil domain-containing protein 13 isoform X2 [Sphaerodactylus townsendi]
MESDEQVNENLKMQLKTLQEQQQKRLQILLEKKKEKQQNLTKGQTDGPKDIFGVPDDLALSTLDCHVPKEDFGKRLLEDEIEQLHQQLRETVDENGRLYRLLKERDFEIKQLQKKIEEERLALMGTGGLPGDVAASKIVQLAKQNRHLTAEAEKGKTKVKQLNNRIKELEKELHLSKATVQSLGGKGGQPVLKTAEGPLSPEVKTLQDKLSAANLKVSEYRNQLQTMKQELKVVQKLLGSEVGEEVSVQNLMSNPGSWRGRAQQILVLQGKVRELENQLGRSKSSPSLSYGDQDACVLTEPGRKFDQRNLQRIRSLEREKKEALEKLTSEYSTLQRDHEEVKRKLEASKARNQVLSSEVKTLKEQISTLLDKGKHDDELIDALMSQQKEMQIILKNLSQQEERNKECRQSLGQQLNVQGQKQSCIIEQLKQTLAEREARVRELEEKVGQLPLQHLHRREEGRSDSASSLSAESLEEEHRTSASRKEDHIGRNTSVRIVSHMGHTLVDSAATSSSATVSPVRPLELDNSDVKAMTVQITEYRALCQAAEAERDRLVEMVGVLQKRVDESCTKVWEAEKKLQEQQRKTVALEQQLETLKTDAGKHSRAPKPPSKGKAGQPSGSTRLSWSTNEKQDPLPAELSEVPPESQIEDLSTRLTVQLDENAGLKAALENLRKIKEEDFRAYQETMGQIKEIFLQALRQHKQEKS